MLHFQSHVVHVHLTVFVSVVVLDLCVPYSHLPVLLLVSNPDLASSVIVSLFELDKLLCATGVKCWVIWSWLIPSPPAVKGGVQLVLVLVVFNQLLGPARVIQRRENSSL